LVTGKGWLDEKDREAYRTFRINNSRKESVLTQSTATFVFPVDMLRVQKICPADAQEPREKWKSLSLGFIY